MALSLVHGVPLAEEPGIGALTIPGYLREVTERYGEREAVVLNSGTSRVAWSYVELWQRSMDVAKALVAAGVGKNERVAILMTNRPEFLSALFGISMAGGVAVALSTFSTPEELAHLLHASDASILLFEERVLKKDFRAMLLELEPGIASADFASTRFPYLNRLVALGEDGPAGAIESWDGFLATGADVDEAQVLARMDQVSPTDPGGIFFSSGTTSLPKGILHSQRAFAIQWWRWPRVFAMREPVRSWTGNGFFWSGNVSMVVGAALSTGGAVVLQRWFDAEDALRLIEAERVTFINGRPHQWARFHEAPNWASVDLSSLRYIPRGELVQEHPTVSTDWMLPMSFGTTETMTICTSFDSDTSEADYAGSCGVPLPGNTLKIVDPLSGALVPVGARGEMCIKGPTLMTTYLGKAPEECFDAEGFYCTGDGGYVDEAGRFFWEGRLTDMIKTGGANVAPEEVDAVAANYPGILRCQTVGVPDDLLGEMVVACVVPGEEGPVDADALTAFLKERLASFKVPKRVLFFTEEELQVTGSGKVKTAELRALATARLGTS